MKFSRPWGLRVFTFGMVTPVVLFCGCGDVSTLLTPQGNTLSSEIVASPADFELVAAAIDGANDKWLLSIKSNNGHGGGGQLEFVWDFGDGTSATGTEQTFAPTTAGIHIITVTAYDGNGREQFTLALSLEIPVAGEAPTCTFTLTLDGPSDGLTGPRPLSIESSASILQGTIADDAILTWTIDGETVSGPVAEYQNMSHTFHRVGAHVLAVALTSGGLTVSCVSTRSNSLEEDVTVWPRISGKVTDANGVGLLGATVTTGDGETAVTGADGSYSVDVAPGWSGQVTPSLNGFEFAPPQHAFSDLSNDATGDFASTSSEPPEDGCTFDADCDDGVTCTLDGCDLESGTCSNTPEDSACDNGLFCDGPETCDPVAGCVVGAEPCADQACDEALNQCVAPPECTVDSDCDDGLFCNGAETCSAETCVSGSSPCAAGEQCHESTDACQPAGSWVPPIGIPRPTFGIEESHEMYQLGSGEDCSTNPEKCFDFGSGLETYPNAGNGPYTHYVDNSVVCTDSSNPYGSPGNPKCTFPLSVPPGSVVEIHGGPYDYNGCQGGKLCLTASGTADAPVFFRGVDSDSAPIIANRKIRFQSQYVIVEHIDFDSSPIGIGLPDHHVVIRRSKIHDYFPVHNAAAVSIGVYGDTSSKVTDIVLLENEIYNAGDWLQQTELDVHGILVRQNAERIWLVDNRIYHCGGDSIQVNFWGNQPLNTPARFIYIGRNEMFENFEDPIDLKVCHDVIISENVMHSFVEAGALVIHTGQVTTEFPYPERVWVLNNHFSNMKNGVASTGGNDIYSIGNVFRDIRHFPEDPYDPGSVYSPGFAIHSRNCGRVVAANNTIYGCDAGITATNNQELILANNIIADIVEPEAFHVAIENGAPATTLSFDLLYQKNAATRIRWGGAVYNSVTALHAATGQAPGSFEANPLFEDAANGNLRTLISSPAVDAVNTNEFYTEFFQTYGISIANDRDGVQRPAGNALDIGAYEK